MTGAYRPGGAVDPTTLRRIDPVSNPPRTEPGRLLDGRYRLLTHLADGGMASVWLALDERLEREVALKILRPGLAADPEFVERFRQEARSAARLSHPGLVAMFDQGRDGDDLFLVMEFVPGRTLRQLVTDEAPVGPGPALDIIDRVLDALAAAHRAGMVHRDVKPENVIVRHDGSLKVADFGLTRAVAAATTGGQPGVLLGTVSYLSPEQVEHGNADARSDVYACGLILYELLTGRKAFDGETAIHVAYQHVHGSVPAPSTAVPDLPEALDRLVALATARDPSQRPDNAADLLVEVRRTRSVLGLPALLAPIATTTARLDVSQVAAAGAASDASASPAGHASGGPGPRGAAAATTALPTDRPGAGGDPATGAAPNAATPLDRTAALPIVREDPAPQPAPPTEASGPRRRRRRGLVLILLLLLAVGGGAGWWFLLGPGATTVVPKVGALHLTDAQAALAANHLVGSVTEVFDETIPKGQVISATPPAGATVHRGTTVALTVSKGQERYAAPPLVKTAAADAKAALAAVNLALGTSTPAYDETIPEGSIIAQDPPAGTALKRGASVSIVVSKGRAPIPVADWRGKPMAEAVAALTKAGLKVTQGTPANSDTVAKGNVLDQSPVKGTLFKNDTITLVESKGPVLVQVPDVVSMQRNKAVKTLQALGFRVNVENLFGGFFGTVRFQDPPGGSMAPKGSTVTIQVV